MYQKHIGIVIGNLLRQAEAMKVSDRISTISLYCSQGAKGPQVNGRLTFRGQIFAHSDDLNLDRQLEQDRLDAQRVVVVDDNHQYSEGK